MPGTGSGSGKDAAGYLLVADCHSAGCFLAGFLAAAAGEEQGAGGDGGAAGVDIGAAEGERAGSDFFETAGAGDRAQERDIAVGRVDDLSVVGIVELDGVVEGDRAGGRGDAELGVGHAACGPGERIQPRQGMR